MPNTNTPKGCSH